MLRKILKIMNDKDILHELFEGKKKNAIQWFENCLVVRCFYCLLDCQPYKQQIYWLIFRHPNLLEIINIDLTEEHMSHIFIIDADIGDLSRAKTILSQSIPDFRAHFILVCCI